MTSDISDEHLVQQTLAGDTGAFAVLVRRHRRGVLARAAAIVGEPADADDVAQEVFLQAYEHLATCRTPAKFVAWLFVIVKHRALNHLRTVRRRRVIPLDDALAAATEPPLAELQRQELRRELWRALKQLSPVQREVVLLADLEEWSHQEIAEATGLSVTMSRRHLSDARQRLRTLLASPEADR